LTLFVVQGPVPIPEMEKDKQAEWTVHWWRELWPLSRR